MQDDVRLLSPDALNPLPKPAVIPIVGMLFKISQCASYKIWFGGLKKDPWA